MPAFLASVVVAAAGEGGHAAIEARSALLTKIVAEQAALVSMGTGDGVPFTVPSA